jgi:hypothetical protein
VPLPLFEAERSARNTLTANEFANRRTSYFSQIIESS